MSSRSTILALSFACLVLVLHGASALFPLSFGSVGTIDFFQYWHSWRVIRDGNNPYDPALAIELRKATPDIPMYLFLSWNPPWTFVLLSPFTSGPFETCAMFWMLFQFILLAIIATVTAPAIEERSPSLVLRAIAVIVFFPALDSLYFGQLGITLATSVALFLFFQQRRSYFWAGVSLLPLSVKPHIFYLLVVPGVKWILQLPKAHALRFMCGALGGFGLLISVTIALSTDIIYDWIAALRMSTNSSFTKGVIPFPFWQTTTLTTWIRLAFAASEPPSWPLKVVPSVALVGTILYFLWAKGPIVWKKVAPPLLCVSLLTSSYGWVYDQSVLIVPQMAIVCGALSLQKVSARFAVLTLALGVQILAVCLSDMPQHYFVWLPIAMLLLLLATGAITSSQRNQGSP